ncbi:hypothetical protein BSF38_03133 [Paludisphaera borealis]|uniref:Uncharacterized protein n=1 Tax=Paludisphaera borealis TaxID=1387353 RepID=A0A1U7CRQ0_9BACT|nr:hypothetical protein BSF38_03133 [Paludisphaera borealis]
MPFFLLIPILIVMGVVCLIAAILAAVFFMVVAFTGLAVAFILHKLGYDRRLIVYVMQRGRTSRNVKVKVDDLGVPVTRIWTFGDEGPGRPV